MAATYDVATDSIRGEKLQLFLNDGTSDLVLAYAKTCDINISADTIDASNKMAGAWKVNVAGQLGYTISAESLTTNTTGQLSYDKLKELMVKRSPVKFNVAEMGTADALGTKHWSGSAYITSLDLKTDNGQSCTTTISLQGNGELVTEPAV